MNTIEQRVNELLAQMTLDEKIAQLGSYWMYDLQTAGQLDETKIQARLGQGIGQITRVAGASTLEPLAAAKAGNRLQKFLLEHTRLGIPAILHEESCAGPMLLGGSVFPQMLGLAASFQPELAEQMTGVIRQQLLAIGARQALAPVLDVARDPRWGRTEETFGEDPTLVSHFGVAYIRGLQGDDLKHGVLATGKHFIGHSLSLGGLNCGPVQLGQNELYNTFLAPFQAAIRDAGLATMMNAYPELDGEVVAASSAILTELLRRKLGFDGLVVSDYEAVLMLHNFHRLAPGLPSAARLALQAGIDVELPTVVGYGEPLKAALAAGELDLETLDTAVRRHLYKKFELGLFENPYADEGRVLEVFETPAQRQMARRLARQSLVLLKNDGLLPLPKSTRQLALIGPNGESQRAMLGDYSYAATLALMEYQQPADSAFITVDRTHIAAHDIQVVTLLQGIQQVAPQTQIEAQPGCGHLQADTSGFAAALAVAQNADVVVLALGDLSGLTLDCTTGETRDSADLRLPGAQEALSRAVLALGKPVVVVLMNGRPYAIPWLAEQANAILEAWIPGEEGGAAIAEALFGEFNPGGKLPISFPRHVGQLPVYYNHKPSGQKSHWYGDYVAEKTTPLFPFGHGLSYTSFAYSNLSIARSQAAAGETVAISLQVTNTGAYDGDEVVQLYIRDEYASSPRPVKELKGYARLHLTPGETRTVAFQLPVNQLAFYDNDLNLVVEAGTIQVMLGSSSADIRLNGAFEISGPAKSSIEQRLFVCPVQIH